MKYIKLFLIELIQRITGIFALSERNRWVRHDGKRRNRRRWKAISFSIFIRLCARNGRRFCSATGSSWWPIRGFGFFRYAIIFPVIPAVRWTKWHGNSESRRERRRIWLIPSAGGVFWNGYSRRRTAEAFVWQRLRVWMHFWREWKSSEDPVFSLFLDGLLIFRKQEVH